MKRLLLVEDDLGHAELIARAFESVAGEWSVTVAASLTEAKACLILKEPTLVLSDYRLPDGRGDALVEISQGRFPVVLLTAFGSEEMAVEVIKAGALDYIVKSPESFADMPFRASRVLREWEDLLLHRKAARRLERLNQVLLQLGPDYAANVDGLAALAGELLDGRVAFYARLDEGNALRVVGRWQTPPGFPDWLGLDSGCGTAGSQFDGADGVVVFAPFDCPFPGLGASVAGMGLQSCMGHLVKGPGGQCGWLCVLVETVHTITENDRQVLGLLASALNVEEARRRADEALAQSEAQFRAVWSRSKDGMQIVDGGGVIRLVNQAYAAMVGRSIAELEGHPLSAAYASEDGDRLLALFLEAYARREVAEMTQTHLALGDGRRVWFEVASSFLDPSSPQPRVLSVFRDVTERELVQERLRRSEERFRALLQGIPSVAVQGYLADGTVQYWNRGSEIIFGYPAAEAMGRDWVELIVPPESRTSARELIARMAVTGGVEASGEFEMLRQDGTRVPVYASHAIVPQHEGFPMLFCVVVDLSSRRKAEAERLEMERQLLHGQKLESLGVLAGGIAHDFNNLLTSMLGNIGLALMDLSELSPARRSIQEAERAIRRAADLTRQMLAYSGRGMFQVRAIDLSELVEEMAQLLKVSISKTATLQLHLSRDLPSVLVDAAQIQQVVMNLITNASEAIGGQTGSIVITTSAVEADAAVLAGSHLAEKPVPGRFVMLEVSDTGCGMDETVKQRLFDPFFTTKFTGRGLGMSAVLGVVRGHKGAISVTSQPGQGSAIRVLFPASDEPVQRERLARAVEEKATDGVDVASRGTVLVVDDEVQVRHVAERALARAGYRVLTAGDGQEALRVHAAHVEEIDCVVLDLSMPKMDGVATFRELQKIAPGVRAILASGYDRTELSGRLDGMGFEAFVQKPFELARLIETVRAAVGKRRSGGGGGG